MDESLALRPLEHVVFTDLSDEEGILVDLNRKQYFQLNETAVFIWRRLEEGQTAGQISRALTEAFEVETAHAAESVSRCLNQFVSLKLVSER
jgi:hypothetical protein